MSNFKPNLYDFILLDIKMPGMNGFELCDKIKKLDSKAKVCFISAYDPYSDELKEQFLSLKIECFIPKPIQVKELVERIRVELSRQSNGHTIDVAYILMNNTDREIHDC